MAPDDIDALKAKLVLLIEVSRFDEALVLLNNAALAQQAPYEQVGIQLCLLSASAAWPACPSMTQLLII